MSRPVSVNTNCLQIERQADSNYISNQFPRRKYGDAEEPSPASADGVPGVYLVMRDLFPTALHPPVFLGEELKRITYENVFPCMNIACSAQDISVPGFNSLFISVGLIYL